MEKAKRKKIASFKLRKKQSTENDDVKAAMFFLDNTHQPTRQNKKVITVIILWLVVLTD